MQGLFIPTQSFWRNGNDWYGSLGDIRFYIQPVEGADGPTLTAKLWRGPLTLALSEVLEETCVPLGADGEGLAVLTAWLEERIAALAD